MQKAVPGREYELPEEVVATTLEFGRLLMEAGASAHDVEEVTSQVACGLGAERFDVRLGYASLAITISNGSQTVTLMRKIGPMGVNQRLYHALRILALQIQTDRFTCATARTELNRISLESPRHPEWIVAIAVGIACAAFGRLLAVDWIALVPIFLASFVAQLIRSRLGAKQVNVFLSAVLVSFLGSALAGFGSRLVGSTTLALDMIVTVLLLVPGVPAFIAQLDILEGRPTLGSARTIWVVMILIYMTAGVWMAQGVLRVGR